MTLARSANGQLSHPHQPREPIAIIGIGCRLPGAVTSPDDFWNKLLGGFDAIGDVPPDRWSLKSYYDAAPGKPGKSHACRGGFVDGIDQFDAPFFGISPREAARMDPQQRLLLEVAWEALEDGGQPLQTLAGNSVSVFVGISSWDYSVLQTSFRDRGAIDAYMNTGNSLSIAANRISYCLNLKGQSTSVDTACSSALVAVHMACQSIWVDGAALALAGGVNALLAPDSFIAFSRMGMLSPDGRCKAFDARANGFVRSEGTGIIVLKPLTRATADGDRIYAVIRGTASNQDGHTDGMTVPSQQSQEDLLRRAYRNAGVNPSDVQYVEAHGTGTPVGDPIEARAIGTVLGVGRKQDQSCLLGSVKTNIGHLEAGSGIAGLIKTALALHHRQIPGNLHHETPNPNIDFAKLHLRVPSTSTPWPARTGPALAGVNSFGYGGTNAHVVLQEGPAEKAVPVAAGVAGGSTVLVPLSARSPEGLSSAAIRLKELVESSAEGVSLHDIAVNSAERRTHHSHRLAVVARSKEELTQSLEAIVAEKPSALAASGRAIAGHQLRLAFICSGQGPQWWAMGRQLLEQEPVFRSTIERCDAIVRSLGPWSVLEELSAEESRSRMAETAISQPSIFALQVGLAALWESWGVRPEALVGHSVGEVAAAYLAGVFDLEDATRVIYHRGRCMDRASSRGKMLAAALTEHDATSLLEPYGGRVSLAAINSPNSVTLSGEAEPLEQIAITLEKRNVFARFLQVQYAFHSAQVDPVRDELLKSLKGIRPKAATIPLISTVFGRRVEGHELGPDYWWLNVRQTVRFAQGIGQVMNLGCDTALEVSPHPVLCSAVSECYQEANKKVTVLPSLRRREDERATMLRAAAELHVHGYELNWKAVLPGPRRFVRLPSYPWQHQRYWFESEESRLTRLTAPVHPLLGRKENGPRPTWEARLDLRLLPDLAHHRVQGVTILPATAYLECAFAVAREVHGGVGCQLDEVKLKTPCFPPQEGSLGLNTSLDLNDPVLRIESRPTGSDKVEWTSHFQARIRTHSTNNEDMRFDREAVRSQCPRGFERGECYDYFSKLGLDYGTRFQGIERCWAGEREAVAEVNVPGDWSESDEEFLIHPALLDSCLHAVIAADADFNHTVGNLYLPVEVERVRLFRKAGRKLWSHARLREKTPRFSVADVDVYDDEGRPVISLKGLRSQCVNAAKRETLDDLLYAYQRVERPPAEAIVPADPGAWLIFSDQGGTGDELAAKLRQAGDECCLVLAGPNLSSLSDNRWQVNPSNREEMSRLLEFTAMQRLKPLRGIVHLWSLDAPSVSDLETRDLKASLDRDLLSVLHLVQCWEAEASAQKPELVLVTRGAQAIADTPIAVEVSQSPLIGFGRVIINESASFHTKLLDIDSQCIQDVSSLEREIRCGDGEDEVALREGKRFAHRYGPVKDTSWKVHTGNAGSPYRLTSSQAGTIDGLMLKATSRKPPEPGFVEIEVRAAGLNFSDVMKALGLYPGLAEGPIPFGAECSGVISALGSGVEGWVVGDEVVAAAPNSFASHVTTRQEFVARKPAALAFEAAATIPIAYLTSVYALGYLGRLEAGESVLIHSATGGVGLAAIQVARRVGATVYATAGSDEKRSYLSGIGIPDAMDSRSLDFAEEILRRTGSGVDVVLNSLAGEAITSGLSCLKEYGRFLEIGKRDIYQNSRLGLLPFRKNLSFFAIDLDRVMRERPSVIGKLFRSIMDDVTAGRLQALPHQVYPVGDVAGAFRFMQHGKHIGKVVISMAERPAVLAASDEPLRFKADASYLITGGLGGFGLALARWLAERGATQLVLTGRRGVETDEARTTIADLEQKGVQVLVLRADVSKVDDVARLLQTIRNELPPLRGIFHAAMVLEDSLLQNLDAGCLHRVLGPKVQGAWNLHRQTLDHQLDAFVLFSSLSSVFGHAGQANYAAANSFLDSLSWHRRAQGLPSLTINWGHLGEVGYIAQRHELSDRLSRQGVLPLSVKDATALLERAMQLELPQISAMRVDWSRWNGLGVTGRVSPRFAHLVRTEPAGNSQGEGKTSILSRVLTAPEAQRAEVLGGILCEKLSRVLGTSPGETDWDASLLHLGLDSLMAVEVVNWVQAELGVVLPVVELLRSPGVSDLTRLLLDRLPASGTPSAEPNQLALAEGQPEFPLSYGQRALGFIHELAPASPGLNLSFCSRIRSAIEPQAFRTALQHLVDRHPALRTVFREVDGELKQITGGSCDIALEIIDATRMPEAAIRARIEEESLRPFDLANGPLLRMYLFTRSAKDHVFLFVAHHIVGDFWSLVVLLDELRVAYPAALAGTTPRLPTLTGDYKQFVSWQLEQITSPAGERHWNWWRNHLDGTPFVLDLPADRPRPARFTHRGGCVPCHIDENTTARLKEMAAGEQATLFTGLLAAFHVLIARYSGQNDFVIGSPFAGRPHKKFEGVVGYFINMLPLRARVESDQTFRGLLRRVGTTVFDAFQHQDYPFPLIVERLAVPREHSRTPLVQVAFTLEKAHRNGESGASRFLLPHSSRTLDVGGFETEPFAVEQRICQADLEVVLEENAGAVEGMLCYNTDLFEKQTAERIAVLFQEVLTNLLDTPDRTVSRVPLLTGPQRKLVLEQWNRTDQEFEGPSRVHEMFEEQVRATPDAIAVRQQERVLTYCELNVLANRIAAAMTRRGVTSGSLVAISLERSPELIATILGVLKAGAAYVPLDPAGPVERLRFILSETQSLLLVTHERSRDTFTHLGIDLFCPESDVCLTCSAEETPIHSSGNEPADLAYVIFTSGSTGTPKGVLVDHGAVCNTVRWRLQAIPTASGDRVLLSLPHHFDASVTAIFPTLASGAELVLARPGEERNPTALLSRIAQDRVTMVQCLPATLEALLDEPGFSSAGLTLRKICCGGEVMPTDLPERVRQFSNAELYNLYGLTETAVEATSWKVSPGCENGVIPIGKPTANTRLYVLDPQGEPVPVGVVGELYVAGKGLARGYLNDQKLTAERFVPDPFNADPDARMFRTGDLVRWRADGALLFEGRVDNQLKFGGVRIEPAEIERAIRSLPGVRDVIVTKRAEKQSNEHLVACIVPQKSEEPISTYQLRQELRKKLPQALVPSQVRMVTTIPKTATGKVDYRKLFALGVESPLSKPVETRPGDKFQAFLLEAWSDVLGGENLDLNDNFFEVGGSSLPALQLVGRLRAALGVNVPVALIFDSPTIAGLSRGLRGQFPETITRLFGAETPFEVSAEQSVVEGHNGTMNETPHALHGGLLVPLQPYGSEPPLFLIHPPGGVVACYQALAARLGNDRPVYGVRSRGLSGEERLPSNLEEMAADYVEAIRTVQPTGPYFLAGWSLGGVIAYEIAQQLDHLGETVELLALLDSTLPFGHVNARYLEGIDQTGREFGLEFTLEQLGALAEDEQLPFLWGHVRSLGLVADDVPVNLAHEIIEDLKRLFHRHVQLVGEYAIRPYTGRVTLFRPTDAPVATTPPLDRGWSRLAGVDVRFVPGQHHTMVKEPHVGTLANELLATLNAEKASRSDFETAGVSNNAEGHEILDGTFRESSTTNP